MLSENLFSSPLLRDSLQAIPVSVEMASIHEWTVAEERDPDFLYTVFVSLDTNANLQVTCACSLVSPYSACIHGLAVIDKFHDDELLRVELAKRQNSPEATRPRNASAFAPHHF
jgi:hypothetical protein